MTKIMFYVLSDGSPLARERMACRLLSKSFAIGLRAYLHVDTQDACQRMDNLLWTFNDHSFVPHSVVSADPENSATSPIVIGHGQEPQGDFQYLLNLTTEVPHFFSRFEKAAEIVDTNSETIAAGRLRYKFYQDRGYKIDKHDV